MVIKNLENKIRLTGIVCTAFLVGCVIISVSSIWTARTMVADAHKKVYVLDGNVPILVSQTTMDETLDVEAKSHVEMFHHYFFTLAPDDKYIRYTMEKAMYLVDETGLHNIIRSKRKVSTATFSERARCSPSSATASDSMQPKWSSPTTDGSASNAGATS